MREFLDGLSRTFASGGPVLVLPTLDLISAVQFDEWLAWIRNKDNALAMDLEAAKYDIFGPDLAPVTFVTAYSSLMKCVRGNPHHPNLGV